MGFHLFCIGVQDTKMKMPDNSLVINTDTATNTRLHFCHFFRAMLYSVRQMDALATAMPRKTKAPPLNTILAAVMASWTCSMFQMCWPKPWLMAVAVKMAPERRMSCVVG